MTNWIYSVLTSIPVVVAVAIHPGNLMAGSPENCSEAKGHYKLGASLFNYEERRAAFQKAVDLCPDYAEAHNNLADAYENLGLNNKRVFSQQNQIDGDRYLEKAEKHYQQALKLKPDLIAPLLGLAVVNMAQGRYPIAIQNYQEVLHKRPGYPNMEDRIRLLKTINSSADKEQVRKAIEIISEITKTKDDMNLKIMGFQDQVVRDIQSRPRQSFNNILFPPWSSVIEQGDPIKQLNEIGQALVSPELNSFRFIIEGHANNVGEFDRNMTLSNDRAKAVKEYFIKNFNVSPDRIITQGFGFTKPKHLPDTDKRNRRVEIVFFSERQRE
ncbi:MAG: OmpA family protein [Syntrophaceae bacterium]|nr:OmpA family protein [Syntrophaceae bacterium]